MLYLTTGQYIVLFMLIGMGVWYVHSYQDELREAIDGAEVPKTSPYATAQRLFQRTKYPEAKSYYEQALKGNLTPEKVASAHFRIADCLDKMDKKIDALKAYQLAIKTYPDADEVTRASTAVERLRLVTGQ